MTEEKKESIGALWLKTSKDGHKYMSGNIEINGEKHQFVVFKNKHKKTEKHPDYVILPAAGGGKPEPTHNNTTNSPVYDQEIPF